MTKFEKWFKFQFGRMPLTPNQRKKLYDARWHHEMEAIKAMDAIERDDKIQAQYTAACYAKNAASSNFSV